MAECDIYCRRVNRIKQLIFGSAYIMLGGVMHRNLRTNTPLALPGVELNPSERKLTVTWDDGATHSFHYVWLRHSARCSNGMPNDTSVKIDLLPDDPESLAIVDCAIEGEMLVIHWCDGALRTRHSLETLRHSAYDDDARKRRKHQPLLWNRDSAVDIPVFNYDDTQSESNQLDLQLYAYVRDELYPELREKAGLSVADDVDEKRFLPKSYPLRYKFTRAYNMAVYRNLSKLRRQFAGV